MHTNDEPTSRIIGGERPAEPVTAPTEEFTVREALDLATHLEAGRLYPASHLLTLYPESGTHQPLAGVPA